MSSILRSDFRIDREFFRPRGKVNRPKVKHLTWRDERRLSLKLVEEERMKRERMICKEIARIAEKEAGGVGND